MTEAQNYKNDFEIYSEMFRTDWYYFLYPLNVCMCLYSYLSIPAILLIPSFCFNHVVWFVQVRDAWLGQS